MLLSAGYQEKVCTDDGDYYLTFNKVNNVINIINNY